VNSGVSPESGDVILGEDCSSGSAQRIFAEPGASVYAVLHGDIHLVDGHLAYRVEPFALTPRLVDPVQARRQPSRLLAAENRVVPFAGRADELRRLATWRDDPLPGVSVMLLHGAGGQGKSRLAAQFAIESAQQRWTAWAAHHVSDPTAELVAAPGETGQALVVVVEYAERWPADDLQLLLQNPMLRHPERARVLLVSRAAGGWWSALSQRLGRADIAVGAALDLPPLAGTEAARQTMFDSARDQFAGALGVSPEAVMVPQWLDDDGYDLALNLHMAALVAVDARSRGEELPADPVGLSAYLLDREHDYWQSLYDHDRAVTTSPRIMARVVYTATLVRSQPYDDAVAILERVDIAAGSAARAALSNQAACYPPGDTGLVLEPLYPDRLGEDFVALQTPGHAHAGYTPDPWAATVPARLLASAELPGDQPAWIRPGLTVLIETARRWPHVVERQLAPLLARQPEVALLAGGATLARLAGIPGISAHLLAAIEAHLPSGRDVDLDVGAVAIAQRITEGRLSVPADDATRAGLYAGLGDRQANVGLHRQALQSSGEALGIYRRLAQIDPDAYQGPLSRSLHSVGIALSDLGRHEEALACAEEVVGIDRQLSERDRASYLPGLALSLSHLSIYLSNLGRWHEAVAPAAEAVSISRSLAGTEADTYLPDLAFALEGLGTRWLELARPDLAEELTREAVTLYRQLADSDPGAHLPGLSASVHNLGSELTDLGRIEDALACSEETVAIDRQLAAANPGAYLPDLAMSLSNLSCDLGDMGRYEDAVARAEESLAIRRRLADAAPVAYLPTVAHAVHNLAVWLSCINSRKDALTAAEEAVSIYRPLAEANSAVYLPELAGSLRSLSTRSSDLGHHEDAQAAAAEAVRISRLLTERDAAVYLPDLARSLENIARPLSNLGRLDEAIACAEKACDIDRILARESPASFLPAFASSLNNLGERLSEAGRHEDAGTVLREAVSIYRPLVEDNPLGWHFNLAEALANLGVQLSELRQHEDAIATLEEAVGLYRSLAGISPAAGLPDLAHGLRDYASALAYGQERLSAAFDAIQEAIDIYRPLAEQWPAPFGLELQRATEISADVLKNLGRPSSPDES
jgi:tetratricopeptide (TPR) repeat protein